MKTKVYLSSVQQREFRSKGIASGSDICSTYMYDENNGSYYVMKCSISSNNWKSLPSINEVKWKYSEFSFL